MIAVNLEYRCLLVHQTHTFFMQFIYFSLWGKNRIYLLQIIFQIKKCSKPLRCQNQVVWYTGVAHHTWWLYTPHAYCLHTFISTHINPPNPTPPDVPDPPGKPFPENASSNEMIVSWYGSGFDGGSPITSYLLEMSKVWWHRDVICSWLCCQHEYDIFGLKTWVIKLVYTRNIYTAKLKWIQSKLNTCYCYHTNMSHVLIKSCLANWPPLI